MMLTRDGLGDERECFVFDGRPHQGDERDAEDVGIGAAQLILTDGAARGQYLSNGTPSIRRLFLRGVEFFVRDEPRIGEKGFELWIADVHASIISHLF